MAPPVPRSLHAYLSTPVGRARVCEYRGVSLEIDACPRECVPDSGAKRMGVRAPSLRKRSDRLSARHLDALSVHPAMVLREERRNHRADIVGEAGTAEGGRFRDMSIHLRIVAHHTA